MAFPFALPEDTSLPGRSLARSLANLRNRLDRSLPLGCQAARLGVNAVCGPNPDSCRLRRRGDGYRSLVMAWLIGNVGNVMARLGT